MSDPLTPPPGQPGPGLTPPPSGPSSGLTPPPSGGLTPPPVMEMKSFTFRMTLPANWGRVDQSVLGDAAAIEAQLQAFVDADKLSGAQADAMVDAFLGLGRQLEGLQVPLVAVYAEPTGDGRFALATMFAGPHASEFPLGDDAEPIGVNGADGRYLRGTLIGPFGSHDEVSLYTAQYVLDSPVPPGVLVVTAATPVVPGFVRDAVDARFNEAVAQIRFHPAT